MPSSEAKRVGLCCACWRPQLSHLLPSPCWAALSSWLLLAGDRPDRRCLHSRLRLRPLDRSDSRGLSGAEARVKVWPQHGHTVRPSLCTAHSAAAADDWAGGEVVGRGEGGGREMLHCPRLPAVVVVVVVVVAACAVRRCGCCMCCEVVGADCAHGAAADEASGWLRCLCVRLHCPLHHRRVPVVAAAGPSRLSLRLSSPPPSPPSLSSPSPPRSCVYLLLSCSATRSAQQQPWPASSPSSPSPPSLPPPPRVCVGSAIGLPVCACPHGTRGGRPPPSMPLLLFMRRV